MGSKSILATIAALTFMMCALAATATIYATGGDDDKDCRRKTATPHVVTATRRAATATPRIVVVTATPEPTRRPQEPRHPTKTPAVVIVTATPESVPPAPTVTPAPAPPEVQPPDTGSDGSYDRCHDDDKDDKDDKRGKHDDDD